METQIKTSYTPISDLYCFENSKHKYEEWNENDISLWNYIRAAKENGSAHFSTK